MGNIIFLIMLVLGTACDFYNMRYGEWEFPHLLYGRYNSSLGIMFSLMMAFGLFLIEPDSSTGGVLPIVKVILFVAVYFVVYMYCYYHLNKKNVATKGKSKEELETEKRRDYLLHAGFIVKNIERSDYTDEDIPSGQIRYTVVLEDENGNEQRIKTMDPTYYERKLLTGEKVRIGKKRRG